MAEKISLASDFSRVAYISRQEWNSIFKKLKDRGCESKVFYLAVLHIEAMEKQFKACENLGRFCAHKPILRNLLEQ